MPFLLISITSLCYADNNVTLFSGFRITSSDGQHIYHLGGYLLFDMHVIDETENSFERFDLFNAWLHIAGTFYDTYDYKIQYSLENINTTKFRNTYIAYRFTPPVKIMSCTI